jgi:phosphatidate cytidylyltransferase
MKRVITAIIAAAVFIPVLIFSDTLIFPIVISLMGGIAAFEILSIRGLHKKPYLLIPTLLFVMVCPLVSGTDWFSVFTSRSYNFLVVAFPAYMIYLFFIAVVFNRKVVFSDITYICMSISYVALAMFSVPFIKERARLDYLLLIICPCATDIAALYGGKRFGKKKLCPAVSQHKTVEGFFFGIIGSVIGALLYGAVRWIVLRGEFEFLFLVVAGIGISIVGQYGDLAASLMKRSSNVKDFGNVLPGHGGIMDRFDSIFASFACAFIFLTAYNRIFMLMAC